MTGPQGDRQLLQLEILQQHQKVSKQLDQVEERISMTDRHSTPEKRELSTDSFLQSIKPCKSKKTVPVLSSSSSDDSDEPSLELLKCSRLQRKVDKRLRDLSQSSHSAGKLK